MRRKNFKATNMNIRAEEGSENPSSGVHYTLLVKVMGNINLALKRHEV